MVRDCVFGISLQSYSAGCSLVSSLAVRSGTVFSPFPISEENEWRSIHRCSIPFATDSKDDETIRNIRKFAYTVDFFVFRFPFSVFYQRIKETTVFALLREN